MTKETPLVSVKIYRRDKLTPQCDPIPPPQFIVETYKHDHNGREVLLDIEERDSFTAACAYGMMTAGVDHRAEILEERPPINTEVLPL